MFVFEEIKSNEMLKKSYRFRYKVIKEDKNPFYLEDNEEEVDIDEYDEFSKHFVCMDSKGEIIATSRLIINSPIGYPTPNKMKVLLPEDILKNKVFCEVSRIFIASEYRSIKNAKIIIRRFVEMMAPYVYESKVDFMYAALEKNFLKLLHIININYSIVGDSSYYHGIRYPCILSWEKLIKDNPEILQICKKD